MRNTSQDPSVIPLSAAQYRELAAAVCQAACFWQFSESMRFNLWAALRLYSAEKAYIKAKFPDQLPRALLTLAHELANSEVL